MKKGEEYGCLTVLDMGEEYLLSEQYAKFKQEYDSLQMEFEQFAKDEVEKKRILQEHSSFPFRFGINNPDAARILQKISELTPHLDTHYKCKCKCGKVHYYDAKTIEAAPKYCYYPMFISTRCTYSVDALNATYNKKMKYGELMNVVFVENRTECEPSEKYCGLWNQYKQKQMNKKHSKSDEKIYTVEEWNENGKKCKVQKVNAVSYLDALKKLYPDDSFEPVAQSDLRNRYLDWGRDFNFRVSYRSTRFYKRVEKDK